MSSPHEHDGTHEAIEHFVKEGVGLAIQIVGHYKRQGQLRQQQALRDGRDDRLHQLLDGLQARDTLNKAVASTRWHGVHNEGWWQERLARPTGPAEIVDTYRDALNYADKDQGAAQALGAMNERFRQAPFNFAVESLDTEPLHENEILPAYAEHVGKDPAQLEFELGDLQSIIDGGNATAAALDPRAAEIMAGLKDLQLSQALTTVGSPFSAAEAVDAALSEQDTPQARPERTAGDLGRPLDTGL